MTREDECTLSVQDAPTAPSMTADPARLTHLQRLEAESIHIMREVVAECERPVLLYSMGKDSGGMLRLAAKAVFPARPPFPLLHVHTTWKLRAMYARRERAAREHGMELLVHRNAARIGRDRRRRERSPLAARQIEDVCPLARTDLGRESRGDEDNPIGSRCDRGKRAWRGHVGQQGPRVARGVVDLRTR
jgi:3'-phosphoadenosine 5'-phosphosulfate sulfotransferase (PAPS reductase)/FAD synthetase